MGQCHGCAPRIGKWVGSGRGREAQRAGPGPLTHFNATPLHIVNTVISDYSGLIKDPSSSKINKQTMFSFQQAFIPHFGESRAEDEGVCSASGIKPDKDSSTPNLYPNWGL